MSPEPPPETRLEHDELGAKSHEPSGTGSRGRWTSILAAVGILVVAAGVAAFLFLSSDPVPPTDQAAPAQGLACPNLQQAAEAYERGDRGAFEREIAEAAKIAQGTLDKSGQAFGKPERIALELELGQINDPERLLATAQDICSELERPSRG